jgi:hypothetical protein
MNDSFAMCSPFNLISVRAFAVVDDLEAAGFALRRADTCLLE